MLLFDGLFEAFEVDHDLLAAEAEHGFEEEVLPAQGEDCGAGEIGAFLDCTDVEAPLGGAEEAGVAGAAGELDYAAASDGIALFDAISHAALVGEVEAVVGDGVEFVSDANGLGGGFYAGDASVPLETLAGSPRKLQTCSGVRWMRMLE